MGSNSHERISAWSQLSKRERATFRNSIEELEKIFDQLDNTRTDSVSWGAIYLKVVFSLKNIDTLFEGRDNL